MVAITNPRSWVTDQHPLTASVGILAFEVAAAMTRLVSLLRSLDTAHMRHLRSDKMRSQGVAYLISTDQSVLLRLACAEIMEELERTSSAVSRFSTRCRHPQQFESLYENVREGRTNSAYALKGIDRTVKKMEKYVTITAKLCEEMEVLAELEAAERKLEQRWSRYSGPIPKAAPLPSPAPDSFAVEIKAQLQKVKRLKEESLWGQSFDRAVALMAHAVCAAFGRVCVVFSPFVPGLPTPTKVDHLKRNKIRSWLPGKHSSGPLMMPPARTREVEIRAYSSSCPIIGAAAAAAPPMEWGMLLKPSPRTVGGAGLAERYAGVTLVAERLLAMREGTFGLEERREEAAAREELYEMLPEAMRSTVKRKLRDWWQRDAGSYDGELAEGWREAVARIMGWLVPVARDTIQRQGERNMDRRQRFDPRPRTMLLQTLHFADREKTEAAIAEVLVGLSLVGWYEERRRASVRF